jgi:hypothetical protein
LLACEAVPAAAALAEEVRMPDHARPMRKQDRPRGGDPEA